MSEEIVLKEINSFIKEVIELKNLLSDEKDALTRHELFVFFNKLLYTYNQLKTELKNIGDSDSTTEPTDDDELSSFASKYNYSVDYEKEHLDVKAMHEFMDCVDTHLNNLRKCNGIITKN